MLKISRTVLCSTLIFTGLTWSVRSMAHPIPLVVVVILALLLAEQEMKLSGSEDLYNLHACSFDKYSAASFLESFMLLSILVAVVVVTFLQLMGQAMDQPMGSQQILPVITQKLILWFLLPWSGIAFAAIETLLHGVETMEPS